ncbi:MAG: hypothetical protein WCK51_13450 [Armatimonadota bacterium]
MGALLCASILSLSSAVSYYQEREKEPRIEVPENLKKQFEDFRDQLEDNTSIQTRSETLFTRIKTCTKSEFGFETTYRRKSISPRSGTTTLVVTRTATIPWQNVKELKVEPLEGTKWFEAQILFTGELELKEVQKIAEVKPNDPSEIQPRESKKLVKSVSFQFEKRSDARKFTENFEALRLQILK